MLLLAACLPSREVGPPPVPARAADLAGEIVYVGYDDELWIARPDGSERRRLTSDGDLGPYRAPRWSPDGLAATDVFHVPHVHHLWLGQPSSAELRLLDEARPHFLNIAWSPGAVLLLALDELHSWKLFWVDTGRSVEISEGGGMWPDWCCRTPTGP